MTVIMQINLEHQDPSMDNISWLVSRIYEEYKRMNALRPRVIQLAHNGPGMVVGEELIKRGLPVELVSPAHWRQLVDPLDDGPTEADEKCI